MTVQSVMKLLLPLLLLAGSMVGAYVYYAGGGWLVFFGATITAAMFLAAARVVSSLLWSGSLFVRSLDNVTLFMVSLGMTLTLVEVSLFWLATPRQTNSAGTTSFDALRDIPEEWKWRPARIEGAARASYWHGKLHVYNAEGFRNAGDYRREEEKYRIVVLGDSLTYGDGIAAEETYPALLERMWALQRPNTKVYNLGRDGAQSEDIVRVAKKWIPILQPHRVLYGICLNDFLPSGIGQYQNNMAWQVPLPEALKQPIEFRTRTGRVMTSLYDRALMALGIRNDFFTDILKDFRSYQVRFQQDLIDLNEFVLQQTGRPVVSMVLDQYPGSKEGYEISRIAEKAAREAGMDVVPTEGYYEKYRNSMIQLHVSKWEGHPNDVANRIFAEMFSTHLGLLAQKELVKSGR